MGFWFYMLAMAMLLPITMMIFGGLFRKRAPRNINYWHGYRTRRSMLTRHTWEFAHKYCGTIWLWTGICWSVIALAAMFLTRGQDVKTVGYVGAALCVPPLLAMFAAVIATEQALKKNFTPMGYPLRKKDEDSRS